jgi:preprotein translocase subunit SecE
MGELVEKVQDGLRRLIEFFKEAWQELKKVHWPSRKEVYAATVVVLFVVVFVSLVLAAVDYILTEAIQAILG